MKVLGIRVIYAFIKQQLQAVLEGIMHQDMKVKIKSDHHMIKLLEILSFTGVILKRNEYIEMKG